MPYYRTNTLLQTSRQGYCPPFSLLVLVLDLETA